jgi:hypothetical protein
MRPRGFGILRRIELCHQFSGIGPREGAFSASLLAGYPVCCASAPSKKFKLLITSPNFATGHCPEPGARYLEQKNRQADSSRPFLSSVADSHGPHAIAVVLSEMDGGGAIGIRRIKERGRLTVAQDPGEAEYPSMPEAAIATGMVDQILPTAEMHLRIEKYCSRENELELPSEDEKERNAHLTLKIFLGYTTGYRIRSE